MRYLLLLLFGFQAMNSGAQTLSAEDVNRIKGATVYIKVTQNFSLTDEEFTTTGTGFFISKDGYVATNYHVIQNLVAAYGIAFPTTISEIKIYRNSGKSDYKTYNAFIYSVDKKNDLAILGIKDTVTVPFLAVGNDTSLIESAPVWVFGYPFGEDFAVIQRGPEISVTKGTVSALRHDDKDLLSTIQIDAEVNHGNSGGPLINEKGKVVGIVNMKGNGARMNFAVPSHFLGELTAYYPLASQKNSPSKISVTGNVKGASVYIDGKEAGKTPLENYEVENGWHTFSSVTEGYHLRMEQVSVTGDQKINLDLVSASKIPLVTGTKEKSATAPAEITKMVNDKTQWKNVLMKEEFTDRKKFETWEQNTGGESTRTWYIEDGMLHQHENNSVLHAITLGDSSWRDYMASVKVKIKGKEGDPRAGIIFRETENGFYLFRIHAESNKAQLAYHCKHPFGWNVIAEKELPADITDKWYNMSVYVWGNRVACFLDSAAVFYANATYSNRGRVGFYSVESKPSFDDLTVAKLNSPGKENGENNDALVSFWFTDHFDMKSGHWFHYTGEKSKPAPWVFSDAGCIQPVSDDKKRHAEFTRYNLGDFLLSLNLTFDDPKEKSSFELYFRKTEKESLTLRFSFDESKIYLVHSSGGTEKILKTATAEDMKGNTEIRILAKGNKIACNWGYSDGFEIDGKKIPELPGTFGISCTNLRLALHELQVNSVKGE